VLKVSSDASSDATISALMLPLDVKVQNKVIHDFTIVKKVEGEVWYRIRVPNDIQDTTYLILYNIVFPMPKDWIVDNAVEANKKGFKPMFTAWISINRKIIRESIMSGGASGIVSLSNISSIKIKDKNAVIEFF